MRIVVDLQSAQSGSRFGGIGRYSLDLFEAMVAGHREHQFVVVLNSQFPQAENEIRAQLRNILAPSNILTFPVPPGCASINQKTQLTRSAEILREVFIANLDPDIVHISSLIEGLHEDVVTSIGRIEGGPPSAVTFYDLIPFVERRAYLNDPLARAHYFEKIRSLEKAQALLAISAYVEEEGARLLTNFRGIIKNINGGIGRKFMPLSDNSRIFSIRQRFRLSKKFILYAASFDQRKNQKTLIEAFARLKYRLRDEYQLVMVGGGDEDIYARLASVGYSVGLRDGDIKFLGRVSDNELVDLYCACDLFAFPSKLEGLGMPVLEAMACGAPVIGSRTSSIKEVIGWDNALFDPNDVEGVANKLEQALSDGDFRKELQERAFHQVKKYSWSQSAELALGAFEAVATRRRREFQLKSFADALAVAAFGEDLIARDLEAVSKAAVEAELINTRPWSDEDYKIGWVTSWAGRCGIANYTRQLISGLSSPPIIFASYKGRNVQGDSSHVIRCWEEGKEDGLIELGAAIAAAKLDAIHIQFNYGFFNFAALRSFITKCVASGLTVCVTLHSTLDQSEIPELQLRYLKSALILCQRLFVHSTHDVSRLAELGIKQNVKLVPLGVGRRDFAPVASIRDEITIATYGFALPGKGLSEIVQAVTTLRRSGQNVSLRMINAAYGDAAGISSRYIDEVQIAIRESKIGDYIDFITDFLSDEESYKLVSSANIVVYPYTKTGESGSAAVRMGLATNCIVATTPLPIFDDVEAVTYRLPGISVEAIAEGLEQLIEMLKRGHPELVRIKTAARNLMKVTEHKLISQFIDEEIRASIYLYSFVEQFRLSKEAAYLGRGKWIDGTVLCATHGLVCYGPYESLSSGLHRITIYGELSLASQAKAKLVADGHVIACFELFQQRQNILADVLINLDQNTDSAEVVIDFEAGESMRIFDYVVSRKWK